jgi:hypothetical protein
VQGKLKFSKKKFQCYFFHMDSSGTERGEKPLVRKNMNQTERTDGEDIKFTHEFPGKTFCKTGTWKIEVMKGDRVQWRHCILVSVTEFVRCLLRNVRYDMPVQLIVFFYLVFI